MSRRRQRERPATPAEQAAFERAAELARAAIAAAGGDRQAATVQLRRAVDRARDPGNLSNVPGRDLLDAIRQRHPGLVDVDQDHDDSSEPQ